MNAADRWFNELTPEQAHPLKQLRALILRADPRIVEEMKWSRPCYAINGLICYLFKAKQHVSMGFQQGAQLEDPNGLLEGTGKSMRHLKFALASDVPEQTTLTLLKAAIEFDQSAAE